MKVLVAAASFSSSISGIQRHAFNLIRCLLSRPEIREVHAVVAPWQQQLISAAQLPADSRLTIHVAQMNRSPLGRNIWYLRGLPRIAAQLDVDLVHLSYPMPFDAAAFRCPTVVTLHDMYPYEIPMNFGFPKFIFNRLTLKLSLRNADAIACVSEATRSQLRQYMAVSVWRKSIHIPNCVEPDFHNAQASPIPGWKGEPFLLCVAQHRRNKNIPVLIRAFARLLQSGKLSFGAKLLVVGIRGPETRRIDRLVRASDLGSSSHFLEGLSEPELHWCYSHCDALIAPSITEGFGLPVAEGLMAGCRIVCSDIPAHREIAEGRCRLVWLGGATVDALSSAIERVLGEPKKQPILLPQFSAAVVAKQYVALYRRLSVSLAHRARTSAAGSVGLAAY